MNRDRSLDIREYELELENRIRNLIWSVSGNYDLTTKIDIDAFERSKYIALYDAILQGALDKYFDRRQIMLYLAKKVFLGADESIILNIAQLCIESAVYLNIERERKGVKSIRKKAFEDIAEMDFGRLASSLLGQVRLALIKEYLYGEKYVGAQNVVTITKNILNLSTNADTMDIIETVDRIYNTYIDRSFERTHGTLADVLAVPNEKLFENEELSLTDELYGEHLDRHLEQLSQQISNFQPEQQQETDQTDSATIICIDEESLKKMDTYVALNYGPSYLTDQESERIDRSLCRGIHSDCSIYFTDGILHGNQAVNYQYKYAAKQYEKNKMVYYRHHRLVKRNIAVLSDIIRKAFVLRNQIDEVPADHGRLVSSQLWRIDKSAKGSLFRKTIKNNRLDFVVDILMDASGSQSSRQAEVAMQGYIISEAMSSMGIPTRVMSFCSFWDYTIMRRFRKYDDDRRINDRLFEYTASSNNRDGLAIKAAVDGLLKREEENKILIVLSDGRPNDININRPNSRNPQHYSGDVAINDTAHEVRSARSKGISVLGVFAGDEKDLIAEKKIFGRDFAYIHNIANFSNIVGQYLRKQIDIL